MICFQISIFEPLGTMLRTRSKYRLGLWFAFKLVSLNHWEQLINVNWYDSSVVICFQISIFEPLGTINVTKFLQTSTLWFAFKLVSLNHWEQYLLNRHTHLKVVICFQISIFEPLGTITFGLRKNESPLWFAFKLVSLNHWEQSRLDPLRYHLGCDLLSN